MAARPTSALRAPAPLPLSVLLRFATHLDEADLRPLADALAPRRLARGESLLQPGEICQFQAIVTAGCLRVYAPDADGAERVLYFAAPGWCVTDLDSLLGQRPARLGIDALEATEILVLDHRGRVALAKQGGEGERGLRLLAETMLADVQRRLIGGLGRSAEVRYREFQRLYPALETRLPQYQVASFIGISAEFFSKLRKRLRRGLRASRP